MATGTKTPNTTEEQDTAYNPGDAHYNDEFNRRAKAEELADLEGSWGAPYQGKNGSHIDSHGDTVADNPNADPVPTENIDNAGEQEKSGGSSFYKKDDESGPTGKSQLGGGSLRSRMKKMGPTGGVIGLMLFALVGLGGGSVTLAGSLLINMKEIFHNDRSDGTRSNRLYSRAFVSNKFYSKDKSCGKVAIKCKVSTMSKRDAKMYIDEGINIEGNMIDENGKDTGKKAQDDPALKNEPESNNTANQTQSSDTDRISVTKMTYPDSTEVKSGKELYDHADKDIGARRVIDRAHNSKAAYYTNQFFSKVLQKFGFTKNKKAFPGDEKNNADEKNADGSEKTEEQKREELKRQQDQAFDQQTGEKVTKNVKINPDGSQEEEQRDYTGESDTISSNAEGEVKPKGSKGGIVGAVIQGMCSSYKLANSIQAGIKLYHYARLGAFALMFLQAADEIKDGRGSGAKTTYLSDNLTYYDSDPKSEKYSLTATDSDGYKTAATGDKQGLAAFAAAYVLGGKSGIGSKLSSVTSTVNTIAGVGAGKSEGRQNVQAFCRKAKGGVSNAALACGPILGGSLSGGPLAVLGAYICGCTATTLIPFVGNIATKALGCDAVQEIAGKILGETVKYAYNSLGIKELVKKTLSEIDVNSDTKGVDAGNAIAAGAGLMLSTTASGYGLKPSSKTGDNKEVTNYIAYTQPLEDRYIALYKDDAKQTPFDISNQYSLLGSFVRNFNVYNTSPKSLYGSMGTFVGSLPTALGAAVTGQSASALYNQPSTASGGNSGRYDHCDDEDMQFINATGDKFCSIVAVSTMSELDSAQKVIDDTSKNSDKGATPSSIDTLVDYMTLTGSYENRGDITQDPNDCAKIDGTEDERCTTSKQASIDKDGTPIQDSQYMKYLTYCTDQRKQPWGAQSEPYEQGSDRDQRWYSGEECMKSTDDNPNDTEAQMVSNFRLWTNYCIQSGTMDGELNCYEKGDDTTSEASPQDSSQGCGGSLDGDAKALAKKILACPNIQFQTPSEKKSMEHIAQTGHGVECGAPAISPSILKLILKGAVKWKITVGVLVDEHGCDGGYHPKGMAADLNGISPADQPFKRFITWDAEDQRNIAKFEQDIDAAGGAGFGQVGCFNSTPAPKLSRSELFADSCNHLHMDTRGK